MNYKAQLELIGAASTCGDCTYCCWSMAVKGIPKPHRVTGEPLRILQKEKPEFTECCYQQSGGCRIHADAAFPARCAGYICGYRIVACEARPMVAGLVANLKATGGYASASWRFRAHRPDEFRPYMEALAGRVNMEPPTVAAFIPVERAGQLIMETLSFPSVFQDGTHLRVAIICLPELTLEEQERAGLLWDALFREFIPKTELADWGSGLALTYCKTYGPFRPEE